MVLMIKVLKFLKIPTTKIRTRTRKTWRWTKKVKLKMMVYTVLSVITSVRRKLF